MHSWCIYVLVFSYYSQQNVRFIVNCVQTKDEQTCVGMAHMSILVSITKFIYIINFKSVAAYCLLKPNTAETKLFLMLEHFTIHSIASCEHERENWVRESNLSGASLMHRHANEKYVSKILVNKQFYAFSLNKLCLIFCVCFSKIFASLMF